MPRRVGRSHAAASDGSARLSTRDIEIDSARQPADNRSPIRSRQAIEDVTCGPRAAGIAAILGKPLFSKNQMRLRHWNLFSLREGAEPRGLGGGRRLRFSLSLSRAGGHAVYSTHPGI